MRIGPKALQKRSQGGARRVAAAAAIAVALLAAPLGEGASATEILIHTGGAPTGEGSTYHNGMGVAVENLIDRLAGDFGYEIRRVPSNGAVANANACAADSTNLCFGIGQGGLDYAAVERGATQIVRNDLPGECAMAFTAEARLPNWKSVMDNAARVTFVVPEGSGSEAFVKRIFALEPSLQDVTPNFAYVSGQDAIIDKVASTRGAVGVFYAYPNPTEGLVNAAAKADLSVMGILSPALAETSEDYYLNRQAPYELTWFGLGETRTVRTMCSKALLFAGDPARLEDPWARGDYDELIRALKAAPEDAFIPDSGPLARLMREVEGLSAEFGVAEMVSDLEAQVSERLN